MGKKSFTIGALAVAAMIAVPGASRAQMQSTIETDDERRFSFDAEGGLAIPATDLSEIADPGPTFGAGIGYALTDRFSLRADGDIALLEGKEIEDPTPVLPDLNLYHYNAGVALDVAPPTSPWEVAVNVAGGATTIDGEEIIEDGPAETLSETYPAVNGGVSVGYDVTRNFNLYLGGQWYMTFADEEDTEAIADATGEEPFDLLSSVPLVAGLEVKL